MDGTGDINGHHEWWDSDVTEDARGVAVTEWMESNRMVVLNDGSRTRVHKGTGRASAPDVSMCHESTHEGVDWTVKRELSTDHFPIVIATGWKVNQEKMRPILAWKWRMADWVAYQSKVREEVARRNLMEYVSVSELERQIREVILSAAMEHVGQVKLCTTNRAVLDGEIRQEMEKRDRMKENWSEENAEEVKEQEEKVRKLTNEKKKEKWMEEVSEHADYSRMWKLLNRLKERKSGGTGDCVLRHKGMGYVGRKAKANIFAKEYAQVSYLKIPWQDRGLKRDNTRRMRRTGPDTEDGQSFKPREIKEALKQVKADKAAGPDLIHPRFLRKLPDECVLVVAKLFDMSWNSSVVPQNWRRARVIPLLKEGKSPEEIPSYRPISLTSTLGKWMERAVANRLTFVMESKGLLCQEQAGFRATRSVEDQLLRLSQDIMDGFQARERTVMALFDFAKAYDKVWRTGLLHKLLEMGLSVTMVKWVRAWLANRLATVMIDQEESQSVLMREGLPQGSVLSPLLFLVFINDVTARFPAEARVSIFADDMAAWARHKVVNEATSVVQQVCDCMREWSDEWHMTLNVGKCEVTLFTLDAAEARLKPRVLLQGEEVRYEANPKFLGVVYDRLLNFNEHVRRNVAKARKRIRILRAVASTEWGFTRGLLRCTYMALIRSVLEYAGPCWMPWIGKGNWEKLEGVQREAARVIVGAVASSPSEAVLEESGLDDLFERGRLHSIVAFDRSRRLPHGNPRRGIAEKEVRRRVKKREWRGQVKVLWEECVEHRQERGDINIFVKPWGDRCQLVVDVGRGVRSDIAAENRSEALSRLQGTNGVWRWTIYTDGSVAQGGVNGGAAAVVTTGPPDQLDVVDTLSEPAGAFASSYQAEMVAVCMALEWLAGRTEEWTQAGIASDSLSSLQSLESCAGPSQNTLVGRACEAMTSIGNGRKVTLMWVPGHCEIPGNELADQAAAVGSNKDQKEVPWCFDVAKARIWSSKTPRELKHERTRNTYGGEGVREEMEEEWSREEAVSYRRFRIGHSLGLQAYRHRIGLSDTDLCYRCGQEAEDNTHVLLGCASLDGWRFQFQISSLKDLCAKPGVVLRMWNWFRRGKEGRPPE
jgi:ribonuclease HI